MQLLLALDAGTTSVKAVLFDEAGHTLGCSVQEYRLLTPAPDRVELPAETYWAACRRGIRELFDRSGLSPADVVAVSVSSQGETIIPIDRSGQPLCNAIVWLDNRPAAEAAELARAVDLDAFYGVTGLPEVIPTWPACKILWFRQQAPEVFARAHKFLLLEDYLLYRLTGQFVTEGSVSTSTGYFDIRSGTWWPLMLDLIGITAGRLPELRPSGSVVGPVSAKAAGETGLPLHTRVVTGAMDQVAGAIGAGNIAPGVITETTGTTLALAATLPRLTYDPQKRLPIYYHALPGTYILLPYCQTAGIVLKWFRDEFGQEDLVEAQRTGQDAYDLLAARAADVPAGAEGLLMLPHLSGSTSPNFNPAARGVFFGISLKHGKGHFVRAIMEAVAFMLRENLDVLRELGIELSEVRALGGGAKSPLWLQIMADVNQLPVRTMQCEEAAALGVSILAATAVGLYSDIAAACAGMVGIRATIEPRPEAQAVYDRAYERYLALYRCLRPLW